MVIFSYVSTLASLSFNCIMSNLSLFLGSGPVHSSPAAVPSSFLPGQRLVQSLLVQPLVRFMVLQTAGGPV